MKKSNLLITYLVMFLVAIFVLLVGVKIYYELNTKQTKAPELNYVLSPVKTSFKVGEKISVPVYLTGKDAGRASAFDIKFYYDNTKLRLDKTIPGGFFEKYITIKWDSAQTWFALALTPSANAQTQSTLPMLTLEFRTIAKTDSTQVTTSNSTVYLTSTGGFHPQTGTVNFNIK